MRELSSLLAASLHSNFLSNIEIFLFMVSLQNYCFSAFFLSLKMLLGMMALALPSNNHVVV